MEQKLMAGIDEAGRGCVLGPMLLSICVISKDQVPYFKKVGVKDSKLLSKKKREELFNIIKENAVDYKIIAVPAQELNVLMERYSLNEIEAQKIVSLLTLLEIDIKNIDTLILDSPDVNTDKFKNRVLNMLYNIEKNIGDCKIKSEHKADLNFVVVGCASILAKVTRDNMLKDILKTDEISGYPSDKKTIDFLKTYILKNKKVPEFTRTKWKTVDNIFKELYQKKIGWFNEK